MVRMTPRLRIAAITDEFSSDLAPALDAMAAIGMTGAELRVVWGRNIMDLDGADSHSAEAVRSRIKELIDKEPAEAVLSDDQLVAVLKNEGVDIARRTVAKYRESLKIPSSVQRRREKSLRSA